MTTPSYPQEHRKALQTLASARSRDAVRDISASLNALLADTFARYLKTKNFHWHMSGPHFRDYHLLLDDHGKASDFGKGSRASEGVSSGRPTSRRMRWPPSSAISMQFPPIS
jgi:hypothetical protein